MRVTSSNSVRIHCARSGASIPAVVEIDEPMGADSLVWLKAGEAGPVLPVHLALALLGGAALFFALMVLRWQGPLPPAGPVPSLALLVVVTAALLLALWQARGGLGSRLRSPMHWLVLGLVAGLPLLLAGLLYVWPGSAGAVWPLVALSILAGSVLEYRQAH